MKLAKSWPVKVDCAKLCAFWIVQ